MIEMIIWLLWVSFGLFQFYLLFIAGGIAVIQERKIWSHPRLPSMSIWGSIKCWLLNVVWMESCLIGSILTIIASIVTFSNTRRYAHHYVEHYTGKLLSTLFICPTVKVIGKENIPPESSELKPAPIYIANHHSEIDPAVCYYLERSWRWIAKSSIIFLPGVGLTMYLSDHVMIDRVKKKKKPNNKDGEGEAKSNNSNNNSRTGARHLYIKSNQSIQNGIPMFFFPQGTRRIAERLPFKDGAFKIALENSSLLVPVSINIPLTAWNSSYPFGPAPESVVLTVHKPIKSEGKELEALKKECFDVIYSVLPDYTKDS